MTPDHKYYPRSIEQKLGYLVEECGEVLAAVGKTQRWGLDSYNPDKGPDSETNQGWILRELADLEAACAMVREALSAPAAQPPASFEARRDAAAKAIYAVEEPEFGPDATDARGYPRWGNYYEHAESAIRAADRAATDALAATAAEAKGNGR